MAAGCIFLLLELLQRYQMKSAAPDRNGWVLRPLTTTTTYTSSSSENGHPAGCYRWTSDGYVYFNTHIAGGSDAGSQPLCSPASSAGTFPGLVFALQSCGLASGVHRRVCCCSAYECSAHEHRRDARANDGPAVRHTHG